MQSQAKINTVQDVKRESEMTIKAGEKLPSVNFKKFDVDRLSDISSESYCKGREVALFSA